LEAFDLGGIDSPFLYYPIDSIYARLLQDAGASSSSRAMRSRITADVMRAISEVGDDQSMEEEDHDQGGGGGGGGGGSRLRRAVMKRLRQQGHNAAICKSKWRHGRGVAAGNSNSPEKTERNQ
jgi:hypothetical protein